MLEFMKCLAEAIAANGVQGLMEMVPGGNYAYKVGADALKRHKEKKAQKKLENDAKEMIEAKADAVLAAAKQAVEESTPQLTDAEKERVIQYLATVPQAARQSMRRKEDPTGSSLPFGYTVNSAEDVAKIMPPYPPRFVPGERLSRLNGWVLEQLLGGGGFGEVWLVRNEITQEERAVKFCTDPQARTSLVTHEKEQIVRVMNHAGDHPNILPLLQCNLVNDPPWLMYEYIPGGTLADLMPEWKKLTPMERLKKAVPILHALASAVSHFHAITPPIVHRDLKPSNVLMAGDSPRITDFGIGGTAEEIRRSEDKVRLEQSVVGRLPTLLSGSHSLLYSSPQQRAGSPPDTRDDVHALGVIAFQLLTGDPTATPGSDLNEELSERGVPEELIKLIGKSVAQNADRRPKDAREWEYTLSRLFPKPSTSELATKGVRKVRLSVPGTWYSRSVGGSESEWRQVTSTPAMIPVSPEEEYLFIVCMTVRDRDMEGFSVLSGVPEFQSLQFSSGKMISDAGLAYLQNLTSLRQIKLSWAVKITDVGLLRLRGLVALEELDIGINDNVTRAGIVAVQEAIPKCKIKRRSFGQLPNKL